MNIFSIKRILVIMLSLLAREAIAAAPAENQTHQNAHLTLNSSIIPNSPPQEKDEKEKKSTPQDVFQGVQKLSEYLYVGKAANDLWLVMERIDDGVPNANFRQVWWKIYTSKDKTSHNDYYQLWAEGNVPKKQGFIQFQGRGHILTSGQYSFETSLNYHTSNELWIGFASSKNIAQTSDITADCVEMAVPVMTDKDAPMVTHMGIGRSFYYMIRAIEDPKAFPLHGNLAMDLHSFAAKIIKIRDPKKLYMMTAPVPTMREIMVKALPNNAYVGDTWSRAEEEYKKKKDPIESLISPDLLEASQKLEKAVDQLRELSGSLHSITYDINAIGRGIAELQQKGEGENVEKELKSLDQLIERLETEALDSNNDEIMSKEARAAISQLKKDFLNLKNKKAEEQRSPLVELLKKSLKPLTDLRPALLNKKASVDGIRHELQDKLDLIEDKIYQERTLQETARIAKIAVTLKITPKDSPILIMKTPSVNTLQILDPLRSKFVFEHDKKAGSIKVNGKELTGNDLHRYDWFYHRDMIMNPYTTIDLDALAGYGKLMN